MAGRCGVEDDVVEAFRFRAGKKLGKAVEGSNLDGARSGELFFHLGDCVGRKHAAIRCDNALTQGSCLRRRVHLFKPEPLHSLCRHRRGTDFLGEYVFQIGGRIGGDQKDLSACIRQGHCQGTGDARLPDASLAGEEEIAQRGKVAWFGQLPSHIGHPP